MTKGAIRLLSLSELLQFCWDEGFHPPLAEFDFSGVPPALEDAIPYAQVWGQDFEDERYAVLKGTPARVQQHLWRLRLDTNLHDLLDGWLAGPAADHLPYSSAYIAFSCLNQTLAELDHKPGANRR